MYILQNFKPRVKYFRDVESLMTMYSFRTVYVAVCVWGG